LRTADEKWAISDFGLAVEAERQTTVLTSTLRAGLGSWCYTGREQFLNARSADQRSDIYSLGKILQEMVTGELPFTSEMPSSPLRPVVEKATAQRPDARYPTAEEFLAAVERAIGDAGELWENAEDVAKRLLERVRLNAQTEDLTELLSWGLSLDEDRTEEVEALSRVLPRISARSIKHLWSADPDGFRRLYLRYAHYVARAGFQWDYCDVVADFGVRAASQTKDHAVLSATAQSLAQMGHSHNRWHVRTVLVHMLQEILDAETAVAAAEGLRAAGRGDVQWVFNDFTVRSLHPALRAGIIDYLEESA
jgi:serine/threonine protein kinase